MANCDERAAWLRLTLAAGIGAAAQRQLLAQFGGAQAIFDGGAAALSRSIGSTSAQQLFDARLAEPIASALRWSDQPGNRLLTLADPDYPQTLLETPNPPTLLYAKGRTDLLAERCIAIVGSRSPTPQGARDAEAFAQALADAGITVVSGLALGIDGAAHRGALRGRGGTVAVVGTGIDRVYPARHRDLARAIAENGCLLSEFPLGSAALRNHFPRRNRIIAGLARGVLVVEAAHASGSLITARLAADAGRDVFAIPGSIHSPLSKGCHRLIKDGAKLVDDVRDILDELAPGETASRRVSQPQPADPGGLLLALGHEACDIDTLLARTGMSPEGLAAALLHLELEGRLAALPGGRYQRLT